MKYVHLERMFSLGERAALPDPDRGARAGTGVCPGRGGAARRARRARRRRGIAAPAADRCDPGQSERGGAAAAREPHPRRAPAERAAGGDCQRGDGEVRGARGLRQESDHEDVQRVSGPTRTAPRQRSGGDQLGHDCCPALLEQPALGRQRDALVLHRAWPEILALLLKAGAEARGRGEAAEVTHRIVSLLNAPVVLLN